MEIIGHRGQVEDDGPPENTLAAVKTALDEGADGVEVDVRLTADGVPVCVHDPGLERVAGRSLDVRRSTYAQLRAVPLIPNRFLGGLHRIAAVEDVLASAHGRGSIVLDLKHDLGAPEPLVDATLAAIRRTATDAAVVLSSFSPAVLRAAARRAPDAPRALITDAHLSVDFAARRALELGCEGLHPRLRSVLDDPRAVDRWRRRGLRVRPWTVNRLVDAVCLDALGVEAVITDLPTRLRAACRALAPAG